MTSFKINEFRLKLSLLFINRRTVSILLVMFLLIFGGCNGQQSAPPVLPDVQSDGNKTGDKALKSTISESEEGETRDAKSVYNYNPEGRRDPFKSPLIGMKDKKKSGLTPLQQRSLGELRVIGIAWEEKGHLAMIETPDGKGFLIKEGTLVGQEGGFVKKITTNSVIIEEAYTDYYGKKKSKETVLRLHSKEEGGG